MDMKRPAIEPSDLSGVKNGLTAGAKPQDDLARDVYGVLGIPVDVLDMPAVLQRIENAAAGRAPFFLSTPNLNFLGDEPDRSGIPGIVVGQRPLSGRRNADRLAGASARRSAQGADCGIRYFRGAQVWSAMARRRLSVFLFGGDEGVAAAACQKLNAEAGGMTCVGYYDPGFCTVDEMSSDQIIETINASGADFLVAALGAKKGQAWLLRNHDRLQVPVRVHLGAVINFQAGAVKRAPPGMRKWGLEWLWRIWQEPLLWRRYAGDFAVLLRLVLTQVIPLMILARWNRSRGPDGIAALELVRSRRSQIRHIKHKWCCDSSKR